MPNSFVGKAKPYNGQMTPCKACQKVPNEGDDFYLQNMGTTEDKKWISCSDLECFIKQGGTKPEPKSAGGYSKKPSRTPTERIEESKTVFPILFRIAQEQTKLQYKDLSATESRICDAVFLKALVEIYARD